MAVAIGQPRLTGPQRRGWRRGRWECSPVDSPEDPVQVSFTHSVFRMAYNVHVLLCVHESQRY